MKKKNNNDPDYAQIVRAVNNYLFENHKVCGLNEICAITKIPRQNCAKIIPILVNQKQLYEIYSGQGMPSLYVPYHMMQEILKLQAKPDWMVKFTRKEKSSVMKDIEEQNKKILEYDMFERLLYTTDKPLEKALEFCLKFLEFSDVKQFDIDDTHDVQCIYQGKLILLEAKGKEKQADKDDILQLSGWIHKQIDAGKKADELDGILVINHYRYDSPDTRGNPMTEKAIQYLKVHHLKFFTTYNLYKIIQEVLANKMSKEDARKKIMEGENYE